MSLALSTGVELERRILLVRGHRVMIDSDLAALYHVSTRRLNEQVARNCGRFPPDFAFRLTSEEARNLKSQFETSSWGGKRKLPLVFTEHGAVMLASVLRSSVAVQASVQVVRAFVRLREMLGAHADLARRLNELEQRYDSHFKLVFDAIRALMDPPPEPPKPRIGFHPTKPS